MFGVRTKLKTVFMRRATEREMLRTAFAGDGIEKEMVRLLARMLSIRRFVETGTCTGKTTLWLGRTFPDDHVLTCELLPSVYESARRRLRHEMNIECVLGDSAQWIRHLCDDNEASVPTLYFLDAHGMSRDWAQAPPLEDELLAIAGTTQPSVVIIDDFQVPGPADFAFCVDGRESSYAYPADERLRLPRALNLDRIRSLLAREDQALSPKYSWTDALVYQSDPLHQNLIGYVVILHCCPPEVANGLLEDDFVSANYLTLL